MTIRGSARTLLLAALAAGAAVIVVSIAFLSSGDGGSVSTGDADVDDEENGGSTVGVPKPRRAGEPARKSGEPDGEDPEEGIWSPPGAKGSLGGDREPHGDYAITVDSVREVFAARHWEELRRQIEVLQQEGGTLPPDLVRELMALFAKEDTRLDGVLVLGGVKDDATGRALAELASSSTASVEERNAALMALKKSGQKAALPLLLQLAASESLPEDVARQAYPALAAVGGRDATRTLLDQLKRHGDDSLRDVLVAALGSARDADGPLAGEMRDAQQRGDQDGVKRILIVAQLQGQNAGPEMKAELERFVEGAQELDQDEEERERVRSIAMPAAVSVGVVDPVLRVATSPGNLQGVALHALRQARGDDAARKIAAALAKATDPTTRRELTVALGETASTAATPTLVALLDDPESNVRNAAARGLAQIRDSAANKAVLAHIPKAADDRDFALGLVDALGTIGMNESLPTLEKLVATEEGVWPQIRPFIQRAANRIRLGNPDSELIGK